VFGAGADGNLFQLQLRQGNNSGWSDQVRAYRAVVSVLEAEALNNCINLSGLD